MEAFASLYRWVTNTPEPTDLTEEEMEELLLRTSFTPAVLRRYRRVFLARLAALDDESSSASSAGPRGPLPSADEAGRRTIRLAEFLRLPCVKLNPLRDRLAVCVGFDNCASLVEEATDGGDGDEARQAGDSESGLEPVDPDQTITVLTYWTLTPPQLAMGQRPRILL